MREQFNLVARKYDSQRRCFMPCFDDYYKTSISLLKCYKNDFKKIVDLGAGTGLLTKEIYELYPNAHYVLIDIAKDMLKIAEERFNGLNNFEFLESDYIENIPVENCDLIGSALSIHHLENNEKEALYKIIYKKLDKGGCFINLDQFNAETETINNLYNKWWYNHINHNVTPEEKASWLERRKLDKENTIPETLALLKNSGFKTAECIYCFMKFAVIIAIKE